MELGNNQMETNEGESEVLPSFRQQAKRILVNKSKRRKKKNMTQTRNTVIVETKKKKMNKNCANNINRNWISETSSKMLTNWKQIMLSLKNIIDLLDQIWRWRQQIKIPIGTIEKRNAVSTKKNNSSRSNRGLEGTTWRFGSKAKHGGGKKREEKEETVLWWDPRIKALLLSGRYPRAWLFVNCRR